MVRRRAIWALVVGLGAASCGGASNDGTGKAGASGSAGASGGAGTSGAAGGAGATAGAGGSGATAGASGAGGQAGSGAGGASGGGAGATGGTNAGAGGATGSGAGGATDGGAGATGMAGATGAAGATSDAGAGPSFLPAGYTGTPFTALRIPGRINACDYDRGGAGVAWCHNTGACAQGTVTGDWYPAGSAPYRPPIPANAQICSGAACADNVGVCRMSPNKPDRVNATTLAPASDTYLCYSTAGEWTKYTVVVAEAGTYAVGGFMAVPMGGGVNISFGGNITTGNLTLAVTNPSNCGGGEYFHCWAQRDNLATVTFPSAGTYLMTLTQTGRFNADNFTFTKM
jgi:hypothetical protein